MKAKLLLIFSLLISFALISTTAEARRFGGGRSIGKSWSHHTSRSANTSKYSRVGSHTRSGMSRGLKGAFMGLVAGGLIGALFFGSGFHGFQGLDLILLAGLAFILFRIFQKRRMMAGAYGANHQTQFGQQPQHFQRNGFSGSTAKQQRPDWFNEPAFIEGAKQHFMRLQSAWDREDMREMQSYCTPELFEKIAIERQALHGMQKTEVLSLDARLIELIHEGNTITAGIQFNALIRSNNEPAENISEIWSVQHRKNSAKGDWLVAGIDVRS